MAIQNFDELNIFKQRSVPYETYYGEMILTDAQKKKRIDTALILEDILSFIFELIFIQSSIDMIDITLLRQEFINQIYEYLDDDFFDDESQFEDYLFGLMDEMINQTVKNLKDKPNDYDYKGEKPYWVSEDRAKFVAENEANTLCNNKEYVEAVKSGKTHKIWVAFPDERVRPDHKVTNGSKIPIDAYFTVGSARMLFPKDLESEFSTAKYYPEEVISCRCQVEYI